MATTTTPYSFYQVANINVINSGYSAGDIVFNKTRKEITVFGPNSAATVYAGGLTSATFANQILTIVDNTGTSLTVDLNDFATVQEVTGLLGSYYNKTQVDGLLNNKANKATSLSGYGITDAYTKTEVDETVEAIGERIDGVENSISALPSYTIKQATTAENGYSATYQLYTVTGDTETAVGAKINIPKDMVVESGSLVKGTWNGEQFTESTTGTGLAIKLVIANATNDVLYINVANLVDTYSGSTYISVNGYTISINTTELDKAYLSLANGGTVAGQVRVSKPITPSTNSVDIGTIQNKFRTVYATTFSGNATSATKATKDGNDNVIVDTYATKTALAEAGYWKELA